MKGKVIGDLVGKDINFAIARGCRGTLEIRRRARPGEFRSHDFPDHPFDTLYAYKGSLEENLDWYSVDQLFYENLDDVKTFKSLNDLILYIVENKNVAKEIDSVHPEKTRITSRYLIDFLVKTSV